MNGRCIRALPGIDPAFFVNLHLRALEFIELLADGSLRGDVKETAVQHECFYPLIARHKRRKEVCDQSDFYSEYF